MAVRRLDRSPIWWTFLVISALILLVLGVSRAFDLAESRSLARDAIGEDRWYFFAVRPDLHDQFRRWLDTARRGDESDLSSAELGGAYDLRLVSEADRSWLLTILRYSCPGSAVVAEGTQILIEPSCRPELPEFLGQERRGSGWIWLVTMGCVLVLGHALTAPYPMGWLRSPGTLGSWIAAWLVGWAVAAMGAWILWTAGLRDLALHAGFGSGVLGGLILLWRVRREPTPSPTPHEPSGGGPVWSRSECVLVGAGSLLVVLSFWKLLRSAVWSWDHLATWGYRARKIAVDSLEFLERPGFNGSNPDYPLGVAFSWLVGTAGEVPGGGDVRLVTLIMLLAIVGLLFSVLAGLSFPIRVLIVGAMLGGPLAWDTEGLGLAELPLVLWITLAVFLWTDGFPSPRSAGWWSLLVLAMLAWTKHEGLLLAATLGLPGAIRMRKRNGGRAALMWCASLLGTLLAVRLLTSAQTPYGTSFLAGDVTQRVFARLREPQRVLELLPETLLHPQWLPWYLALVVLLGALAVGPPLRLQSALGPSLVGVSGLVVVVYVAVYFGTYLAPADHVATSWHRVLIPALWTLLLGLAVTVVDTQHGERPTRVD